MITNTTANNLLSTVSRQLYPKNMGEVIDWADFIWLHFGRYTNAIRNSIRYFLGDINLTGSDNEKLGSEERKTTMDELEYKYQIFAQMGRIGDEFIQYGNAFISVEPENKRNLSCPKCKSLTPAEQIEGLAYSGGTFRGQCRCGYSGDMKHIDSVVTSKPLNIKLWNPRLICIDWCPTTKSADYSLILSRTWKDAFARGDRKFLADSPIVFLEALDKGHKIKFKKEYFKHLKCHVPATLEDDLGGWGLPLFMNEFNKVIQLQMLAKYNEVIISDYSVPFRVISPPSTAGAPNADPLQTYNMANFKDRIEEMVAMHRQNPSSIMTSPFPLTYQILGGEAKNLVPIDVIENTIKDILAAMSIPAEFSVPSLSQLNGPPIALRNFEQVWSAHISALDEFLQWFVDIRSDLQKKEKIVARLVRSSIYEDDISREDKAKLALSNVISMDTGLRPLGIDMDVENTKMLDEANRKQDMMQKNDEEQQGIQELQATMATPNSGVAQIQGQQQQAAAAGGASPGAGAAQGMSMGGQPNLSGSFQVPGGAGGAGGGRPSDIESLWAEAEQTAQNLITMDPTQRRSNLIQMSKNNPELHAFVKKIIDQQEGQAGTQGKQMARTGQMPIGQQQ